MTKSPSWDTLKLKLGALKQFVCNAITMFKGNSYVGYCMPNRTSDIPRSKWATHKLRSNCRTLIRLELEETANILEKVASDWEDVGGISRRKVIDQEFKDCRNTHCILTSLARNGLRPFVRLMIMFSQGMLMFTSIHRRCNSLLTIARFWSSWNLNLPRQNQSNIRRYVMRETLRWLG